MSAEIHTDFEHDIKLVRHAQRWSGGSRTMMEHIVHPKTSEEAECARVAMNEAMKAFVESMERAGYKVRQKSSDGSLIGLGRAP